MTARELAHDFAPRSALATRGPGDIPFAEMMRELADERASRTATYPALIAKSTMTRDDAARHMAVWRAIEADFAAAAPHQDRPGTPEARSASPNNRVSWADKLRELRRELALRRNAYPKWLAKPTATLTAAEAARKLEALDAIHWLYWHRLFAFTPAGEDPRIDLPRLHWIATREAERAKDRADRTGGKQVDRSLLDGTPIGTPDRQRARAWRNVASWLAACPPANGRAIVSRAAYPAGMADQLAHVAAELDRRYRKFTVHPDRDRIAQVLDVFDYLETAARVTDTACPLVAAFGTLPTRAAQPVKEAA